MVERNRPRAEVVNPQEWLDEKLAEFGKQVRAFDELKATKDIMWEERGQREQKLDELDPIKNPYAYPEAIAYDALIYYFLGRRISAAEKQMRQMDRSSSDYDALTVLGRRRLEVRSLGDAELQFLGPDDESGIFYPLRVGRLNNIKFTPGDGGRLAIMGRLKSVYEAHPLIDRKNDYQPAFDIKILD